MRNHGNMEFYTFWVSKPQGSHYINKTDMSHIRPMASLGGPPDPSLTSAGPPKLSLTSGKASQSLPNLQEALPSSPGTP